MKPSSHPPRTPSRLSESVHCQLNMYALAATATGVGVLALAQPADAKIIYTRAHRLVPLNHRVSIDLNGDGIADFYVKRSSGLFSTTGGSQFSATLLSAWGAKGNAIAAFYSGVSDTGSWLPSPLRAGQQVSSHADFVGGGFMADRARDSGSRMWRCIGAWNNLKHRYLGLKFEIKSKTHYGWARLSESCNRDGKEGTGARALLTGYAYETIPNKSIITGKTKGPDVITLEPGSLGALAAGASRLHSGK